MKAVEEKKKFFEAWQKTKNEGSSSQQFLRCGKTVIAPLYHENMLISKLADTYSEENPPKIQERK